MVVRTGSVAQQNPAGGPRPIRARRPLNREGIAAQGLDDHRPVRTDEVRRPRFRRSDEA